MGDQKTAIVPFGKYKGQPVDALAADRAYCEWLAGQEWFRTKFTAIHTLIINHFTEPDATPEHNALQARFLSPAWQARFLSCAQSFDRASLERIARQAVVDYDAELARRHEARQRLTPQSSPWEISRVDDTLQRWERHGPAVRDLRAAIRLRPLGFVDVAFEVEGADVVLDAELTYCDYNQELHAAERDLHYAAENYQPRVVKFPSETRCLSYRIECKPSLGDEYPAVLRQMTAAKTKWLVLGAYTGVGVTFKQMRDMFAASNIRVLTVAEIEATEPWCDVDGDDDADE
jgi:hypothetical protein